MKRFRLVQTLFFAASFAALLWGYGIMFLSHAPGVFNSPEEDMSYAWYVPLFSLYVLWAERKKLLASLGDPSWLGLVASIVPFALGFLGIRGAQVRLEIVGFALFLVMLTWTFFGWSAAKRVTFPALFLFFCLPFNTYADVVTVPLRLFTVAVSEQVLTVLGVEVVRNGTALASPSGSFAIDVAAPCSGLRSLFAMMALTAGYAYFNQRTWTRRAVLFALSVPIAILGNIVRIVTIALVGTCCSAEFATGFYHDYSGFVVFAVAIAAMIGAGEVISRGAPSPSRSARDTRAHSDGGVRVSHAHYGVSLLAFLLVLGAMVYQVRIPTPAYGADPVIAFPNVAGMTVETVDPGKTELDVLPKDTRLEKRRYVAPDGTWFLVTAVVGGRSKSSVHRPELCLPSQGFVLVDRDEVSVGGRPWETMSLEQRGVRGARFAYTFSDGRGFRTASHLVRIATDVWDRSVLSRIDRWTMVTVVAATPREEELVSFLANLKEIAP